MENFIRTRGHAKLGLMAVCMALLMAVSFGMLYAANFLSAKADVGDYTGLFEGYSATTSKTDLYNATNTYDYLGARDATTDAYYDVSANGQNAKQVAVSDFI